MIKLSIKKIKKHLISNDWGGYPNVGLCLRGGVGCLRISGKGQATELDVSYELTDNKFKDAYIHLSFDRMRDICQILPEHLEVYFYTAVNAGGTEEARAAGMVCDYTYMAVVNREGNTFKVLIDCNLVREDNPTRF